MSADAGEYPNDLKGKLNWLVEHYRKPNGERYNNREIAEAIGATAGYIHRLRNDPAVNNPTLEMIKKLGRFFGVGLHLFDDDFSFEDTHDVYSTLIGSGLSMRMPAMETLSIEDQRTILQIIDNAIKLGSKPG